MNFLHKIAPLALSMLFLEPVFSQKNWAAEVRSGHLISTENIWPYGKSRFCGPATSVEVGRKIGKKTWVSLAFGWSKRTFLTPLDSSNYQFRYTDKLMEVPISVIFEQKLHKKFIFPAV